MRWSIEELLIGWKVVIGSNRRNIFKKIFAFFRYLPRALWYTCKWVATGYFPTTWWMTDSIMLESVRGYLQNYIKNMKRRAFGFSPIVLYQLKETEILNDETSRIAMMAYELIVDRISFLISCVLEEDENWDRYPDKGNYEEDSKELFMLLEKYHAMFWD
jgi:hypothetical protein